MIRRPLTGPLGRSGLWIGDATRAAVLEARRRDLKDVLSARSANRPRSRHLSRIVGIRALRPGFQGHKILI